METTPSRQPPAEGQVTLTQMLKALDKDVASGVEKKLKKLSKKKAVAKPLDKNKADLVKRQAAYSEVSKSVTKWDPIISENRRKKQLTFPLDQQPDVLPSTAETLAELKPTNELEEEVQRIVGTNDSALHDNQELTKAEEKYLKAISSEEAASRHRELQRMRVLLSCYAAKMRRQKRIKSKSYRRLLKQEKIKKHIKKVESDKDLLLDEIDKLKKLRAQERASLKHKNTGKWAKHAKFRAKYDEQARQAMIEQIGLAEKNLKRPAELESDEDESQSDEEDENVSDNDSLTDNEGFNRDAHSDEHDDDQSSIEDDEIERRLATVREQQAREALEEANGTTGDRLIVSSELISDRFSKKKPRMDDDDDDDCDGQDGANDDNEDDEQRKLISEAFADDDVVSEFKKAKAAMAGEEQPKNVDLFLPGWGDWAGPGIKVNKKKRKRYIIKAKKLPRRDDKIGHVIISEQADAKMKDLMVKKLPRGIKTDKQLAKTLNEPITATFVSQSTHRETIKPRIQTKMGARIEPISKARVLKSKKAKWA